MDGTQRPTNKPSSLCPLNQRPTDSRKDIPAAATKSNFDFFDAVIEYPFEAKITLRSTTIRFFDPAGPCLTEPASRCSYSRERTERQDAGSARLPILFTNTEVPSRRGSTGAYSMNTGSRISLVVWTSLTSRSHACNDTSTIRNVAPMPSSVARLLADYDHSGNSKKIGCVGVSRESSDGFWRNIIKEKRYRFEGSFRNPISGDEFHFDIIFLANFG